MQINLILVLNNLKLRNNMFKLVINNSSEGNTCSIEYISSNLVLDETEKYSLNTYSIYNGKYLDIKENENTVSIYIFMPGLKGSAPNTSTIYTLPKSQTIQQFVTTVQTPDFEI